MSKHSVVLMQHRHLVSVTTTGKYFNSHLQCSKGNKHLAHKCDKPAYANDVPSHIYVGKQII